jgi:hypothetical protein
MAKARNGLDPKQIAGMWQMWGTVVLALFSVAVPLTFDPSAIVLAVLWGLTAAFLALTVVSLPPIADRIWGGVARRVETRLGPLTAGLRPSRQCMQMLRKELADAEHVIKRWIRRREYGPEGFSHAAWRECEYPGADSRGLRPLR